MRDTEREVQVAERGEQEWGGFAGDPCDADEAPRDDATQRGARHDFERRAPSWIAEGERGFAQRMRHETHHFFRGARQHRNHQHGERDATSKRREPPRRLDEEGPGDDADDDRWRAVKHVGDEADRKPQPARPVLREIDSGPYPDRDTDQRRDSHDDPRSHNRICYTTARLTSRNGTLGEKSPVDRRRPLDDQVAEDEHQSQNRDRGEHDHQRRHQTARQVAAEGAVHSARLPTAVPRATRQMRIRATAFTMTVRTNRMSPTSNNAERYMFVVASLNSLAIAAAIV